MHPWLFCINHACSNLHLNFKYYITTSMSHCTTFLFSFMNMVPSSKPWNEYPVFYLYKWTVYILPLPTWYNQNNKVFTYCIPMKASWFIKQNPTCRLVFCRKRFLIQRSWRRAYRLVTSFSASTPAWKNMEPFSELRSSSWSNRYWWNSLNPIAWNIPFV